MFCLDLLKTNVTNDFQIKSLATTTVFHCQTKHTVALFRFNLFTPCDGEKQASITTIKIFDGGFASFCVNTMKQLDIGVPVHVYRVSNKWNCCSLCVSMSQIYAHTQYQIRYCCFFRFRFILVKSTRIKTKRTTTPGTPNKHGHKQLFGSLSHRIFALPPIHTHAGRAQHTQIKFDETESFPSPFENANAKWLHHIRNIFLALYQQSYSSKAFFHLIMVTWFCNYVYISADFLRKARTETYTATSASLLVPKVIMVSNW